MPLLNYSNINYHVLCYYLSQCVSAWPARRCRRDWILHTGECVGWLLLPLPYCNCYYTFLLCCCCSSHSRHEVFGDLRFLGFILNTLLSHTHTHFVCCLLSYLLDSGWLKKP